MAAGRGTRTEPGGSASRDWVMLSTLRGRRRGGPLGNTAGLREEGGSLGGGLGEGLGAQ